MPLHSGAPVLVTLGYDDPGARLYEDLDLVVVGHCEDFGGLGLTDAVALAEVEIDDDAHGYALRSRRR